MVDPLPPKYAGLGRRLAAYLVDSFLSLLTCVLVALVIRALLAAGMFQSPAYPNRDVWSGLGVQAKLAVSIAFCVSLGALYVPLCHASPAQATLGKRLANIYVAARDGGRLSFARAFWRWFVQILLGMFGMGLISIVTILVDPKRRAVHDFVAGSVVALSPIEGLPPLEWWRFAVGLGVQVVWLVVTFSITLGFIEF